LDNPLPGIPLVESPLFGRLAETLNLSMEELRIAQSLAESGYAVLDFPDSQLDDRIARIKANLGPRYGPDMLDPHSDKTCGERRIQDAWQFDDDVKAIASNTAILDLLGKLYGRAAFPFQTLNFPVGTQQEAHTDMVHFSSLPQGFMCGVWLAMEDVAAEAGPLFYLPGSHRWPKVDNVLVGRQGFGQTLSSAQDPFAAAWRALAQAHDVQPEPFLARKGQALIWTANLLHGGSLQTESRSTRWSQVTHYYFENCVYYTPAFSDEPLGKLDIRRPRSIVDGAIHESSYLGVQMAAAPRRNRKGVLGMVRAALSPR